MSNNPNEAVGRAYEALREAKDYVSVRVETADLKAVLALLEHADRQVAELRKLATPVPAEPTIRESVCLEADRIVSGDRQAAYGHPIYDFTRTARIWEVLLDLPAASIPPEKVGLCMIGVKLSRECHRPKRDNLVDICGYAKTVNMIHDFVP